MIATPDLAGVKTSYQNLGFAVVFDSPGYLRVVWPGSKNQIGFIGLYLAIGTTGVHGLRDELRAKGFDRARREMSRGARGIST